MLFFYWFFLYFRLSELFPFIDLFLDCFALLCPFGDLKMTQTEPWHCGKIGAEFCIALGSSFGPFGLPFGTPQTAPKSPTALLSCILVASAPVWEAIAVSPWPFWGLLGPFRPPGGVILCSIRPFWTPIGLPWRTLLGPFWAIGAHFISNLGSVEWGGASRMRRAPAKPGA